MIENLHGIQETVNFKENTGLRLYDNTECENYPDHWHSPLEIIMPIKNSYKVVCNNTAFHLREGDIIFINPGIIHSLEAPLVGERLIFQADFSLLHSIKELESTLSIISPALLITAEEATSSHEQIRKLILSIQDEYFADAPLSEAAIYSKLIEIFVLVGREYTSNRSIFDNNTSKQKEYTEKFLFVCDYINEHCTEELTLDYIADMAGFSKFHFSRLFKQFANVSFYKYLNQKRIAYAERLLINPEISVTEVALRSGFASLSSFIRMFKIIKNCTPTEFKKMYSC
ncbi:MAG: AraC family transcriptional regulator [Lachnospiraceae bacterium]|nr:AraC family transcriptional regulator [Lachnospiraceae bacterium]